MIELASRIEHELTGAPVETRIGRIALFPGQWDALAYAGNRLPDIDWTRNGLSAKQEDYCTLLAARLSGPLHGLFALLRREMDENGVSIVSFGKASEAADAETLKCALAVLGAGLFRPFGAFLSKGFWQTLGVDPQAKDGRAASTGYIPFHFDLDQAATPPEYVGLFCVRADPFGGGESLVTNYRNLFDHLSRKSLAGLAATEFSYSTYNLGGVRNPHPLVDMEYGGKGEWLCLFNGKLIGDVPPQSREAALFGVLEKAFRAASVETLLNPGELLLLDQRQVLHGRKSLAARPQTAQIPAEQDRLLLQFYGNPYP